MKFRLPIRALMASTAIAGIPSLPAVAQTPPAATTADPARQAPVATPGVPTQLDAVTTAAMRSRRPLDDVPATV
jgi:hemoglobin/transferrin/lactoferrin receptor protein